MNTKWLRLLALVVLGLGVVLLASWSPRAARATGGTLEWNENGDSFTSFGANASITIYQGTIEFDNSCPPGGTNDTVSAAADIYIIPSGAVPGIGGDLKSVAVGGGPSGTVTDTAGGGLFIDETIGFTQPSGKVGAGTYTVVYDECQDGKLGPEDEVFSPAFQVTIPTNVPIFSSSAIGAVKTDACQQAVDYLVQLRFDENMFDLINYLSVLSPADLADYAITIVESTASAALNVDPVDVALNAIRQEVKHYSALCNDPPDPNYQQVATISPTQVVDPGSQDPLDVGAAATATSVSDEQALTQGLIDALQRYEGAQQANDGRWALIHAREIKRDANLLAGQISATNGALAAQSSALSADSRNLDSIAAGLESWRQGVVANGFSAGETRELENLGLSSSDIANFKTSLASDDFSFTKAGAQQNYSALQTDGNNQITALGALASNADSIISQLTADPSVSNDTPIASAGGPYTVAQGASLSVNAGASTSPSSITSYAWDLNGDGNFDDASGPTATFTYHQPFQGLIGLKVTNSAGLSSVDYAPLTVTETNKPPQITGHTPSDLRPSVQIGNSQQFSVTTSDAESDAPAFAWSVDGASAGSGSSFSYSPTSANLGSHVVVVSVTDANNPQGFSAVESWHVSVLAPDGDADGWDANVDCDDHDASVNPGETEIPFNGKDDDCNPNTPDFIAGSIALSPASASPSVGATQQLTATLTDASGHAVANAPLTLAVTGSNPNTLHMTTNSSGVASFSYQGAKAGDDSAVASATGITSSGASQTLSSNTATIHWGSAVTAPGVPTNLHATPGDGTISVIWSPPSANGGAAIDSYTAAISGPSSFSQTQTVTDLSSLKATFSGLTNGTSYTIAVTAHNAAGTGPAATASLTPGGVPGAPTNVQTQPQDGAATIVWSPPAGASGIDRYDVTVSAGSSTQTVQVTSLQSNCSSASGAATCGTSVNRLTNGTSYTVSVTAHNSFGSGPAATTVVTPVAPASSGPLANVFYVTERSNEGIAKVTYNVSDGTHQTTPNFVSGLPYSGPDSIIFDHQGRMVISNTDVGAIALVDPASGAVITSQVNSSRIPVVADLALDPAADSVVAVGYNTANIDRVDLATGTTHSINPNSIGYLGGVAFNGSGSRLFVSSHSGKIYEIDPQTGATVRSVNVPGAPDGMTYDPSTAHLFASGCGGICELYTGTDSQPALSLLRVHSAIDGDGIAADGQGHLFVIGGGGLSRLDLATDSVTRIASDIPSPDDVAPVVGAGAPVVNQPPALTVPGDQRAPYDDALSFGISATDPDGDKLTLHADGLPGGLTLTDKGDGTGQVSGTVTAKPGAYPVTFTADDDQQSKNTDSKQLTITVTAEDTTLTYTGDTTVAAGGTAKLAAVLKEDGATGIAQRSVSLGFGDQHCTASTDATGTASCTVPAPDMLGPQAITASFTADDHYEASMDSQNGMVFAYLAPGTFVLGDQSAAAGSSVTFWGAQWAKINSLSGGTAPDAFKGFASDLSGPHPACGGSWNISPGNSAHPPSSVPSYMAVVVSSTITKSHNTISGDVQHLVVVRTDAGYAGDPGHAGTGTVVRTIC